MSKELLRSLELKLLDHLGFNTTMEPEMYEQYCQELKVLFYSVRNDLTISCVILLSYSQPFSSSFFFSTQTA